MYTDNDLEDYYENTDLVGYDSKLRGLNIPWTLFWESNRMNKPYKVLIRALIFPIFTDRTSSEEVVLEDF